ncbi:10794_t:CDS:2 [Funneliformis geosporum]|uniref:3241_t:CDS:1 n=1 Tax=Funneliformis geosporum TaxID=1117311 RepID=A0A9W4SJ55_9GLOM|nr:10794_t:CDS:2 [Funneliformis geosporum]CAI2170983.1 3241_t:CDS:2 [Funneliformis geosporum]
MLLGDFILEIYANKVPLLEYYIPDSNLGLSISSVLKSYAYNELEERKEYCEQTSFVAVPEPGTSYEIRFAALNANRFNLIAAKIYVDGKNDGKHYYTWNGSTYIVSGFYNSDSSRKHNFIFDATSWVEEDFSSSEYMEHGGLGAISIYFYKGRHEKIEEPIGRPLTWMYELEQTKVPEGKTCMDIAYTTKFDKGKKVLSSQKNKSTNTVVIEDGEPLAVLHLNYRPLDWIMMKINQNSSPFGFLPSDLRSNKIRESVNKREREEPIPQDPNDDDSDEVVEVFIDKKRKIEVIDLIDSDDE